MVEVVKEVAVKAEELPVGDLHTSRTPGNGTRSIVPHVAAIHTSDCTWARWYRGRRVERQWRDLRSGLWRECLNVSALAHALAAAEEEEEVQAEVAVQGAAEEQEALVVDVVVLVAVEASRHSLLSGVHEGLSTPLALLRLRTWSIWPAPTT